jgi:deoxyribose-phosphate aldolase
VSISELIDYPLLRADLVDNDIEQGCELARRENFAAVLVRPCDLDQAARWIGSGVHLATVIDGAETTSVKGFATRDAIRRGAREIETVFNSRKLRSRQFQYLEMELTQMAQACHESGARLKVHIESEYLDHELKILACRIGRRAGIDCLATNSAADLPLLKEYAREQFQLKFTGPVDGLDALQALRDSGCSRVEIADPMPLVAAWQAAQRQIQTASS